MLVERIEALALAVDSGSGTYLYKPLPTSSYGVPIVPIKYTALPSLSLQVHVLILEGPRISGPAVGTQLRSTYVHTHNKPYLGM